MTSSPRQRIMEQGLDAALFSEQRKNAKKAFAELQAESLPILTIPARRTDLDDARTVLNDLLDGGTRLAVLGAGGSSLGAQGLISACASPDNSLVPVHFTDSLDAGAMSALLAADSLPQTRFLAISKSGETTETLIQTLTAMEAVAAVCGRKQLAKQFAVIAEAGPSPLRDLAADAGIPVLDHDPGVSGRFAILTNVGLMPAMAAGVDPFAVRAGARAFLADPQDAIDGAAFIATAARAGCAVMVLAAYAQQLTAFIRWSRMLIAESLGKDGQGPTPVAALGPGDQHSQLQLWLDGPQDKSFTFLDSSASGDGPQVSDPPTALAWLRGRRVGDLVDIHRDAAIHALAGRGCPIRRITLPPVSALDEAAMGGLAMQFMLETVIAARLFGVDPYTHQALAAGKRHVLDILNASS